MGFGCRPRWPLHTYQGRRPKAAKERNRADCALTRFTLVELFADPKVRVRLVIVFLMSLATTLAWWGISSFVPPYVACVAASAMRKSGRTA
jgi:hypothetical protein